MSEQKLTVKNIGPVKDASLTLSPGVNILLGDNGVGKTHVWRAISRALGDTDIQVPLRDGAQRGELVLNGVTLLAVGKANRNTGDTDLSLVSTSPLAMLVEPNIKQAEAAERARIQALLQLVQVAVTPDTIAALVGNDKEAFARLGDSVDLDTLIEMDIVNAADRVRRLMHEFKRKFEDEAVQAEGEVIASNPEKPERLTDISLEDAQLAYDSSLRSLERFSGEASQRAAREKERAEIEATIGTPPNVELATTLFNQADQDLTACEDRVSALETELVGAKAALQIARAAQDDAQRRLTELEIAAKSYADRKAILESPVTGATQGDVEAAQSVVEKNRLALEDARESKTYRDALEKKALAEERKEAAKLKAEKFEKIAISVTGKLGGLLEQTGLKGLTVEDGVLCVVHSEDKLEPFSRLSFGQRTRIAAELLAKDASGVEGAVVPLDWRFWASLSPQNRTEADQIFTEHGLFVVTEAPTAGPLRAERFKEVA